MRDPDHPWQGGSLEDGLPFYERSVGAKLLEHEAFYISELPDESLGYLQDLRTELIPLPFALFQQVWPNGLRDRIAVRRIALESLDDKLSPNIAAALKAVLDAEEKAELWRMEAMDES